MAIQAMGRSSMVISGFSNPVQNLGMLIVSAIALHAISNLQIAQATTAMEGLCEKVCEPLPGSKDDMPERICTKTCTEGAKIIETKTKEAMTDGAWKTTEILGKIVKPLGNALDCATICMGSDLVGETGKLVFRAGSALFTGGVEAAGLEALKAASRTICAATNLIPGAGYPSCLACCAGLKLSGMA